MKNELEFHPSQEQESSYRNLSLFKVQAKTKKMV